MPGEKTQRGNAVTLTMDDAAFASSDDVRRLQQKLWVRQSAYVGEHSEFYAGKALPAKLEELPSFPLTTKVQLRESQEKHPPFGNYLAAKRTQITRLHRTSGTTGKPINIALSKHDAAVFAEAGGTSNSAAGLHPGLMVAHCLNYRLWMGGYTDHAALEATGATVIPFGVGGTELFVRTALDLKLDGINCTVSYPAVLEQVLRERFPRVKPRDLGLRLGLLTGEPGLENPEFRARIEDTWGFAARNIYGISDILTIFAGQCACSDDMHFTALAFVHPELINSETKQPIALADEAIGELVLTSLNRECQPLVRFRTNDIISVTGTDRCACGRTAFRFRILGRSDDMIVVRGVNVFPSAVSGVINRYSELSGQFRIVLSGPPPYDKVPIEAELAPGITAAALLSDSVAAAIKAETGASAVVRLLEPNTIERTEGKAKRIVRS